MRFTTRAADAADAAVKPAKWWLTQRWREEILRYACHNGFLRGDSILDPSFPEKETLSAARNGFVVAALNAHVQHSHLVLRPEDLWFAILTQFSFYVNARAGQLRGYFVEHEGRKKLEILQEPPMDLRRFVLDTTKLIEENVMDKGLWEWSMPDFSTTTETDKVVALIMMVGAMQKYRAYFLGTKSGIPSVTLLGEKGDWKETLQRLEFLKNFKDHEEI